MFILVFVVNVFGFEWCSCYLLDCCDFNCSFFGLCVGSGVLCFVNCIFSVIVDCLDFGVDLYIGVVY